MASGKVTNSTFESPLHFCHGVVVMGNVHSRKPGRTTWVALRAKRTMLPLRSPSTIFLSNRKHCVIDSASFFSLGARKLRWS